MVHILRQVNDEFYWLVVGKKANTYEELGKSTESYAARQGAHRGIRATFRAAHGERDFGGVDVYDHTMVDGESRPNRYILKSDSRIAVQISQNDRREIAWVVKEVINKNVKEQE